MKEIKEMKDMKEIKKIKIHARGLCCAALLGWLFIGCASAPKSAPQKDTFSFYLMNDTWIWDFHEVRIAAPDSSEWGDNVMDAPLGAGGKALLNASKSFEGALVNLLIYTEDGSRYGVYGVELQPEQTVRVDENDMADF
ncbi:MAG: hypothetical protein LBD13_04830 [Spirochaetaceae bacterium]|jgi:hypothetical protein|nr:hypothetical protein [Spirochaetaceae bacterium]